MLRMVRRHLVAKLGLALVLVTAFGFVLFGAGGIIVARRTVAEQHRRAAEALSRSVAAAVRNAMLQGNGIAVREMMTDVRRNVGQARVRVYSPRGELVFAPPPPAPRRASLPPELRTALTERRGTATRARVTHVIENEQRCRSCHARGELRGVLTLERGSVGWSAAHADRHVVSTLVRSGFVQVMTAGRHRQIDAYFSELRQRAPALRAVTVYGRGAVPYFGDDATAPDPAALRRALSARAPFVHEANGLRWQLVPLPNEPRCHGCHGTREGVRGALAVALAATEGAADEHGNDGDLDTLVSLADVSLRHVMMSSLGRLVVAFMDDVARTGAVSRLALHDAEGRLYHDSFARPEPPVAVSSALRSRRAVSAEEHDGDDVRFSWVEPLANEPRCRRCHGTDGAVRGAVEVSFEIGDELRTTRNALLVQTVAFGAVTIGLILAALWMVLRRTVVSPVQKLGAIADRIGTGDLDVSADVRSTDEIGRLATRLNEMVVALRQRIALTKFVSHETLRSVERTSRPVVLRRGERCRMTVVFSDIRGFTAFSEKRSPEDVVTMLNQYLEAQALKVHAHGGDIDKFVGDEVMARFAGDDGAHRAVLAALDMVEAVESVNRSSGRAEPIAIGVGVNEGEMILGAMGAEERLDFTVIGDAVNLGARLCSAAAPGQVLMTRETAERAGPIDGVVYEPLSPIHVKGKQAPIAIVCARRDRAA
ncbi:MAG: HAMP domain-containing protein [Deltaproteobacteria bacterium]|nr:HAMP domain-containing protein [Deltaproteobacteria bacterium]